MPDVSGAFARIEEELLASMMANLDRHRASGATWAQWQAEQLSMVDAYARDNAYRMGPRFDAINAEVERMMAEEYARAGREQEMAILEAVARGWRAPSSGGPFGTERGRIDALIRATHSDLMRAEHATLRRADDIYREVVFDAQLYAATGAGTYARAVDMAAEDFLLRGIDGIVYKDGSRHTIREYGQMAVRTAVRRAALSGEGAARDRWGVHTVFVNRRADACPECMAWTGQVLIDDVYSSGTAEEAADGGYPLLSDAMAQGLFHPNCRDTMSTWFEGVNDPGDAPTEEEVSVAEGREAREEGQRQADLEAARWQRVADLSLDGQDRREAEDRAGQWRAMAREDMERALAESGVEREHARAIYDVARDGVAEARAAFEAALQDLRVVDGAADFYSPSAREVHVGMADAAAGFGARRDKAPFQTFFHEVGHMVDHRLGGFGQHVTHGWMMDDTASRSIGLGEVAKREVMDRVRAIKAERGLSRIGEAYDELTRQVAELYGERPEAIGGLTDIIQGATRCRACDGWNGGLYMPGHAKSYWNGPEGMERLSSETFAHFFETSMANPDGLATLREWLPETYEAFMGILRGA